MDSSKTCDICLAIRFGLAFAVGVLGGIVWVVRFG